MIRTIVGGGSLRKTHGPCPKNSLRADLPILNILYLISRLSNNTIIVWQMGNKALGIYPKIHRQRNRYRMLENIAHKSSKLLKENPRVKRQNIDLILIKVQNITYVNFDNFKNYCISNSTFNNVLHILSIHVYIYVQL